MIKFLKNHWGKLLLGIFALLMAVTAGAVYAYYQRITQNQQLYSALAYIESGNFAPEPDEYFARAAKLKGGDKAKITMGAYSNVTQVNGLMYNPVLVLKNDGTYDYALTVGDGLTHKTYGHKGRWWVDGYVLNTVLLSGDEFLVDAKYRDKMREQSEIITSVGDDYLELQAPYSRTPVRFQLVKKQDN